MSEHCHHHASAAPAQTAGAAGIYTCPMPPLLRHPGPGICPICGMALEPLDPAVQDASEYRYMLRRFRFSVALSVPVFILAMGGEAGLFDALFSSRSRSWI